MKNLMLAIVCLATQTNSFTQSLQDVTANGSVTDRQITVQTANGGAMFTGRQIGSGYYFAPPYGAVFHAMTDATNLLGSHFFSGYHSSSGIPGSGVNTFYVRSDGQGYFAGKVGIGVSNPAVSLDVNGGIRASGNTAVTVDAALSNTSYITGNFQAYVTPEGYQNGARPGYGFHAGNTLGVYLYANTESQLRIKNASNQEYDIFHSGNFNPDTKASSVYSSGANDLNTFLPPGLYEFETAGATITNSPVGSATSANFKVLSLGSSSRQAQLAFTTGTNDVWVRNIFDWGAGREFLPWAKVYTSANFSPSNYLPLTGGSISGNIGIGAENTGSHKLAVNGSAIFKKVVVKNSSPWPDFVFDSGYKLRSLEETDAFVKKNRHLPDMPTATEVAESGVDVDKIQAQLLQKIEEITLHLIELKKENKALSEKVKALEENAVKYTN